MIKYDYVTNEPVKEDPADTSGEFAFDAAAAYNYNPQQALVPMYQQQPYQQGFVGAPMNTPTMPNQQQQGFTGGYVGNPFFLPQGGMTQPVGMYNPYLQQPMFFQQPQPVQDKVVHVDGYNPYGKGLLPEGIEAQCEQLQLDTMLAQEKIMAEREKRIQGYYINNGYYNTAYNYYGLPYMNTIDQSVYNNYVNQIRDIANAAMQSRINFNKNLSRLVHRFNDDGVTDEDIDKLYDGYTYTIPGKTVQSYQIQEKLERLVPVDNSKYYQQQFANISNMYQSIMPEAEDMNQWLHNCGYLILEDKMEQHLHRLKDSSKLYTPDTFHMYLRRYAQENNIQKKQQQVVSDVKAGNLSTLPNNNEEAAKLLFGENVAREMAAFRQRMESGFVPIGPPNQAGTPVVMTDELQSEFEMRRGAFINSIYNNSNHAQENMKKGVT